MGCTGEGSYRVDRIESAALPCIHGGPGRRGGRDGVWSRPGPSADGESNRREDGGELHRDERPRGADGDIGAHRDRNDGPRADCYAEARPTNEPGERPV